MYISPQNLTQIPKPIIQHSASLQTLLRQEDMRGTPGTGISQRIKNLKYSSQSILSKKVSAIKAKFADGGISNSKVKAASVANLVDMKRRRFKFNRTVSDSSVMAELLVRSVIHVHSSLDSISEKLDPSFGLQKQSSLTNPPKECESSTENIEYLPVPVRTETNSSVQSEASCTSSSDGEVSDNKEESIEYDTVSNIVKNVRRLSMLQANVPMPVVNQDIVILEDIDSDSESDNLESKYLISSQSTSDESKIEDVKNGQTLQLSECDSESDYNIKESLDRTCVKIKNVESMNISNVDESVNISNMNVKDSKVKKYNHICTNLYVNPTNYEEMDNSKIFFIGVENDDNNVNKPPLAEVEDFTIESSDESFSELEIKNTCTNNLESQMSSNTSDTKLVIPPVMMGANIEHKGLIKTAMETILLEKVNIMSTYTPPTSPKTFRENVFVMPLPPCKSFEMSEKCESFFPQITKTFEKLSRSVNSPSSNSGKKIDKPSRCYSCRHFPTKFDRQNRRSVTSLQDHKNNKHDTVLGAPFVSINNGDVRNKNNINTSNEDESCSKLDLKVNISESKQHICERVIKPSNFLIKAEGTLKNVFHMPFTLIHSRNNKNNLELQDNTFIKSNGLLGTALGNVLMESANDILVTSHGRASVVNDSLVDVNVINQNKPTFTVSKDLYTYNEAISNKIDLANTSANSEIVRGVNNANLMHASLHPSLRHFGSSILENDIHQEQQPQTVEITTCETIQSPLKVNSASYIHRRSSDSDISITPKGKTIF